MVGHINVGITRMWMLFKVMDWGRLLGTWERRCKDFVGRFKQEVLLQIRIVLLLLSM